MKTILRHQYIIILCIGMISVIDLDAQIKVYYEGDSICVSNCHGQNVCFKSNYHLYGEFLEQGPIYLLNKSLGYLYIYNPKIELIQFNIDAFQAEKRILFLNLHKEYDVRLDFIEENVFLQSFSRLLLYDENLCLIGDYLDSLENSNPSISELLVKNMEYHTMDNSIVFDITSYALRVPKLDPDSLARYKYSFLYK